MKKIFVILAVLFLLVTAFLATAFYFANKKNTAMVRIGGKEILVEIAKTEEQRERGLSDRKSLCDDCGLLFIFDSPGVYPFWMRRMYFDIDILWIAGDQVVDITYSAKAPSKEDFDQPKEIYQSQVPVDKVLEVNEGWVKKNGIKIGNEVKYPSKPL